MGAVTIALMAFFAFLIVRATAPQMTPLFTDLSVEDSSAIIKDLERQGIPYDIKNEGAIVLVPKEQVPRLRMKLAESGLPKGGGVGYEIFDKSDALGATSFVQNINHLRALEGELARTIRAIDRVQQARVHLVLPERPLFSRDKAEPSASIVLKVRGTLEAAAGAGDPPSGRERGQRAEAAARVGGRRDRPAAGRRQRRRHRRRRHRRRAQARLRARACASRSNRSSPRWSGPGRARVQLTADFDFNRITQTSDKFDPESRVVRSSQTREEVTGGGDASAGAVSVGNELPGANARPEAASSRATRTARPRKSSTTRFPAPPRPR